jgi:hypothetical protein
MVNIPRALFDGRTGRQPLYHVAIGATDVMVGKTRRVSKSGIAEAQNQIAGFLIVEAADIAAAAALFQDHPHITVFPGDGIDVMPVVTGPPED